jgi:hypothetical protein
MCKSDTFGRELASAQLSVYTNQSELREELHPLDEMKSCSQEGLCYRCQPKLFDSVNEHVETSSSL